MIERLRRYFREDNAAPRDENHLRGSRLRTMLGDPFPRRRKRGVLHATEEIVAETAGAELDLPPTVAGVRILAVDVTGLVVLNGRARPSCTPKRADHDVRAFENRGIGGSDQYLWHAAVSDFPAAIDPWRTRTRHARDGASSPRLPS